MAAIIEHHDMYEDEDFPATVASLGREKEHPAHEWLRPAELGITQLFDDNIWYFLVFINIRSKIRIFTSCLT